MNDTVTIHGRVGGDPNRGMAGGVPVLNFRVASPQGWYDAKNQTFVETGTNW